MTDRDLLVGQNYALGGSIKGMCKELITVRVVVTIPVEALAVVKAGTN
jgi:hypothetical protein